MDAELEDWFTRRTWQRPAWSVGQLREAKNGRRVSVVLPALNEESTVGAIVTALVPFTRGAWPLIDELVVVDSGSTDGTRAVASASGARVVDHAQVLPGLPARQGKGEVLWRSLAAVTGDLVVFLDSDLVDFDPAFVPGLLGPLLTDRGVALVKGFYQRPLRTGAGESGGPTHFGAEPDTDGGRVTELLARPLLAALCPRLSGVVQPLGGEYAATRALLESVPFAAGYAVEIGLLLDTVEALGLDALAQVNLGVRTHRHRSLLQLGVTSREILDAVLRRVAGVEVTARVDTEGVAAGSPLVDAAGERTGAPATASGTSLTQFHLLAGEWLPTSQRIEVRERPPMREVLAQYTDTGVD